MGDFSSTQGSSSNGSGTGHRSSETQESKAGSRETTQQKAADNLGAAIRCGGVVRVAPASHDGTRGMDSHGATCVQGNVTAHTFGESGSKGGSHPVGNEGQKIPSNPMQHETGGHGQAKTTVDGKQENTSNYLRDSMPGDPSAYRESLNVSKTSNGGVKAEVTPLDKYASETVKDGVTYVSFSDQPSSDAAGQGISNELDKAAPVQDNLQAIDKSAPPEPQIDYSPSDIKDMAMEVAKVVVGTFSTPAAIAIETVQTFMKDGIGDALITLKEETKVGIVEKALEKSLGAIETGILSGAKSGVEYISKDLSNGLERNQYGVQSLGYSDGIARWATGESLSSVQSRFPTEMENRFMGQALPKAGYQQGIESAVKMISNLPTDQANQLRHQLHQQYGQEKINIREGILSHIHQNINSQTKEWMPVR